MPSIKHVLLPCPVAGREIIIVERMLIVSVVLTSRVRVLSGVGVGAGGDVSVASGWRLRSGFGTRVWLLFLENGSRLEGLRGRSQFTLTPTMAIAIVIAFTIATATATAATRANCSYVVVLVITT